MISPVSLSAPPEGCSVIPLSLYSTLLRQCVFNKWMNSSSPLEVVMHRLGQNESAVPSVPCKDHTQDTRTTLNTQSLFYLKSSWRAAVFVGDTDALGTVFVGDNGAPGITQHHMRHVIRNTKGRWSLLLREKDAQNTEQKMNNEKSKRSFHWVPWMAFALHTRLCVETADSIIIWALSNLLIS